MDRVTFVNLPKTVKTYKTARAAKMAVSKADRAYKQALSNGGATEMHQPQPMGCDLRTRINNHTRCAWINIERTLAAANEQGFEVLSAYVAR